MEYKWIAAKSHKTRKRIGALASFAPLRGQYVSGFVAQVAVSSVTRDGELPEVNNPSEITCLSTALSSANGPRPP